MSHIAWGRVAVWSTIIIGSGYVIMKTTSPTEQQLYDQLAPDLKKKADDYRAWRKNGVQQSELQKKMEEASDAGATGPVWADKKGPTGKSL